MEPRLKTLVTKEIQNSLKEKFGYKNLYMGPQINKIVLNMGLGLDGNDSKIVKNLIYNWYIKEVINQMKGVNNVIWTK